MNPANELRKEILEWKKWFPQLQINYLENTKTGQSIGNPHQNGIIPCLENWNDNREKMHKMQRDKASKRVPKRLHK
jgi:hypothetical protein